jgi:hypothetical protein
VKNYPLNGEKMEAVALVFSFFKLKIGFPEEESGCVKTSYTEGSLPDYFSA